MSLVKQLANDRDKPALPRAPIVEIHVEANGASVCGKTTGQLGTAGGSNCLDCMKAWVKQ